MAMSADEKAVQGIKDPAQRKAAFYTRQRQTAENAASKGDNNAAATASKIFSKTGGQRDAFLPANDAQKKASYYGYQSKVGKTGANILSAGDRLGEIFQPGDASIGNSIGSALNGMIRGGAKAVGKVASKASAMIPESAGPARLTGRTGSFLGKANPVSKAPPAAALKGSKPALTGAKAPTKPSQAAIASQPRTALAKPSKSASKPLPREAPLAKRTSPATGKSVGKGPMDIQSRWADRAEKNVKTDEVAAQNKAAAKQTPRQRAFRKEEPYKRGAYKPAALKPNAKGK